MTYRDHLKRIYSGENDNLNISKWSHRSVEWLLQWHFDIFGFINRRLAIDINK